MDLNIFITSVTQYLNTIVYFHLFVQIQVHCMMLSKAPHASVINSYFLHRRFIMTQL